MAHSQHIAIKSERDLEEVVSLTSPGDKTAPEPAQIVALIPPAVESDGNATDYFNTAHVFLMECKAAGNISSLNTAIYLLGCAASTWHPLDPRLPACLNHLATALLTRFLYTRKEVDVHIAAHVRSGAVLRKPVQHILTSIHWDSCGIESTQEVMELGALMLTDFHQAHDQDTLNNAIFLYKEALDIFPESYPQRWKILSELAEGLLIQFHLSGNMVQRDKAFSYLLQVQQIKPNQSFFALITGYQVPMTPSQAKKLSLETNQNHTKALKKMHAGAELLIEYEKTPDLLYLDAATRVLKESESLLSWGHEGRMAVLSNLGQSLHLQFICRGNATDLESAIELQQKTLELCSATHPDRSKFLNNLASALQTRFRQQGDAKDNDKAIELHREAGGLHSSLHPDCTLCLHNQAASILARLERQWDPKDNDEVIGHYRKLQKLYPAPHSDRTGSLTNLAVALQIRFQQRGDAEDMNEAIEILREALELCPPPHPERSRVLVNLAAGVRTRFHHQGEGEDIDEAIQHLREALELDHGPDQDRSGTLNNLADMIQTRFEQRADAKDIDEAITLIREALELRPTPHPNRSSCLDNLASALVNKFKQGGDTRNIDEAIILYREVLKLHPQPYPNRSVFLNNLANALRNRFEKEQNPKDIDEAIVLHEEALQLRPAPHPYHSSSIMNLANAVQTRFDQQQNPEDNDRAVDLYREALESSPSCDPHLGDLLYNLASAIETRYEQRHNSADLNDAIEYLKDASKSLYSSMLSKFNASTAWAKIADKHRHDSWLMAYSTSVHMLPSLAGLYLDLNSRQHMLTRSNITSLVSASATCAIIHHHHNIAVEFLEASRSIFWTQALHLRTPLEQLDNIRSDLASRLREIARQLEHASFRDTSRNLSSDAQSKVISMEAEGTRCRQLNKDWEDTIKSVQTLPGFEDFMRPKRIASLRRAAAFGPIIILLASSSTCSALVVTSSDDVQCVDLPSMNLPIVEHCASIFRSLSQGTFDITCFSPNRVNEEDSVAGSDFAARLLGTREGSVNISVDVVLQRLLAGLWTNVVKPVFDFLKAKKSSAPPPRLWWCPIGPFAFLPLHAAGIYSDNGTECVSDYFFSSYTPTLSAMLDPPTQTAASFKTTVVIEPQAQHYATLPGTQEELERIGARVPSQWLTGLHSPKKATVIDHLQDSSIVHFACHGFQDSDNPLESGLILSDGPLKVSQIMQRSQNDGTTWVKDNMSLAFLSACETAKGDAKTPDEAMHLAASLIFAGFHGVIATMWSIDDFDGPKVADTFYEHLFKDYDPNTIPPVLPDLTKAAEALHLAVAKLRKEPGMTFKRWVPFIHYGL
ncbi:CHAT domain-containing protein [Mycena galopus ATCC 62051]|nr:CHAT domain-containing protein [Mycena galopus ATCC 62051]